MRSELARRLQAARIEAGYETTEALASVVGKTARQLRNYESGRTATVPSDVLQAWARATNKPLDYFLPSARSDEPAPAPTQHHPGVEALASDAQERERHHVTDDGIEMLRRLRSDWPILTAQGAVMVLTVLRGERPL